MTISSGAREGRRGAWRTLSGATPPPGRRPHPRCRLRRDPPDLANEQLLRQQSRPHRWKYELKGKTVSATKYAAYAAAEPYFTLVRQALGDLVNGKHFFDVVADNVAYEVLYELGWPRLIRGRANLMAAFSGSVESIRIRSADTLIVHKADDGRVVIVEYEVHGTIIATGARYDNRFCSIITLEDRKIAHWRDYMDSHAAWKAMTAAAGWQLVRAKAGWQAGVEFVTA